MVLVSDLRSRLQKRLGITALTTAESDRIDEAIIAGVTRATVDGIPGLSFTPVTGQIPGSAAGAVDTGGHTAGQSTVTVTAVPQHTYPGDFFSDSEGNRYYIQSISGTTIDTGSPIIDQLTDAEVLTFYRRSVKLPTSGAVTSVVDTTNNRPVDADPAGFLKYGLHDGVPRAYRAVYDRSTDTSLLQFYPAPTNGDVFVSITQSHRFEDPDDTTDVTYPEHILDAILERAMSYHRNWRVGGVSPTELESSRRGVVDADGALNDIASQPVARDGRRARGR